jgi:para-aminobenzoate synthetase component 1
MTIDQFVEQMNQLASKDVPFLFLIDFEFQKPFVCPLSEAAKNKFLFNIKGRSNYSIPKTNREIKSFQSIPLKKEDYYERFRFVMEHIQQGNTYLLNLTAPTPVETDHSLEDLFSIAVAPYKLLHEDDFLVFSPECFIKISDRNIFSYPMKGTIDASIPKAEEIILSDEKEKYEHNTIVDLIRNDLAMVANDVCVTKFRYIDRIVTHTNELLQVSSEIRGTLPENWRSNIGDILIKLLPAGSISGAPKMKTVEIIKEAEKTDRGYYTGIFGIFDGYNLESAVNIRYIEQIRDGLQFRSGGGITALSDKESEYNELVSKIYVPTF